MEPDSEVVSMPHDTYVAMWCNEGFESLYNWSATQRQATFDALMGKPVAGSDTVSMMTARARFNPQRHYEIYAFNSTIPERDLVAMFHETPQPIVDWIRKNGEKVYSARANKTKTVIE